MLFWLSTYILFILIFQVAFRHLFMNEDIKTAIDAPRPHHQLLPMKIKQEMFIKKVSGLEKTKKDARGLCLCEIICTSLFY